MSDILPSADHELEAERALLEAAVAQARADKRYATHEDVREWLLKLVNGDFSATAPKLLEP